VLLAKEYADAVSTLKHGLVHIKELADIPGCTLQQINSELYEMMKEH
jgi:hypothetical protein